MKYLRKFATEAEIANVERPSVILISDERKVLYFSKPENGVYIQHINGRLYTTSAWTESAFAKDDANGVAVVSNECSFVIAKADVQPAKWAVYSSDVTIEGIVTTTTQSEAKADFNGKNNTELMRAAGLGGISASCNSYIFPNGKRGYLPSLGEWLLAYSHKNEIEAALSAIKATKLSAGSTGTHWTSTQYSATSAWLFGWATNYVTNGTKTYLHEARPFTTL